MSEQPPSLKVLLVDDHPFVREGIRSFLLDQPGFEVVGEASSGEEALMLAEKYVPDFVLLDINMPVLDGFATLSRIRNHPEFSQLPVLAVTAYAMKEDRERVLGAGFDGYLSKPIDAAALLRELERHIT